MPGAQRVLAGQLHRNKAAVVLWSFLQPRFTGEDMVIAKESRSRDRKRKRSSRKGAKLD